MKFIIGIGSQKAGTSWLADYFVLHPDIYMSNFKELHYFDVKHMPKHCYGFRRNNFKAYQNKIIGLPYDVFEKRINNTTTLLSSLHELISMSNNEKYISYFENRRENLQTVCEITPSYSLLNSNGFSDIRSIAKDVKIIFSMRNPADRLWSALRFSKSHSTDEIRSFLNFESNMLRSDYVRTIFELESVFDNKDIKYIFYEELFQQDTLDNITDFCEISSYIHPEISKKVNVSSSSELSDINRELLVNELKHVYLGVKNKFKKIPLSWQLDIDRYLDNE